MESNGILVQSMSGEEATVAEEEFTLVYREVFSESPYSKTSESIAVNFRRFRSQVRKSTFRAALARTNTGEPVGIAYGYPLSPTTGWWGRLITPVPEEMSRENGQRTFGLMELGVRACWRGRGVARRMHDALLADTSEERVLLNARPDVPAAQATYRSWGYRKIGSCHPWDGAVLHDVMLLDLSERHSPTP